jgi:hypothetical protein
LKREIEEAKRDYMQSSKSFEEVTKARKQLDEKIENIKNRMQQHKVHQAANEKV